MKRSPAMVMAQRRNWAKMRVSGMYATAKQLQDDPSLKPTEQDRMKEVARLLKSVLRKWGK